MAYNLGINVAETEGKTAPALAGSATSVAGLILRASRGPSDRPVRVSNFTQFASYFGAHDARFTGAYAVEGFFRNGGREAWIARVVGTGGGPAVVILKGRDGGDSLKISAGARGSDEAGTWGNQLLVDVSDNPLFSTRLAATLDGNKPARLQGAAVTAPVDLTVASGKPARTLTIDVDKPATTFTVELSSSTLPVAGKASLRDIVDAINAKANSRLAASVSAAGILLMSRAKGASSRVKVVSGVDDDTRVALGFPDGTVEASGAAIAAGAGYDKVQVQSNAGFRVNDWVWLDDGLTQDWRQATSVTTEDDGAGGQRYFVNWAAPAAGEQNEYRVTDGARVSSAEFDLAVRIQGPQGSQSQPVESWRQLTLDPAKPGYAPARVNDPYSGSGYVVVTDVNAGSYTGRRTPAPAAGVTLGVGAPTTSSLTRTAGSDGQDPSTAEYRAAFARFDTVAIQLLAVPETMPAGVLTAVTRVGLDYCAGDNKGDCFFVGHTPEGRDEDGAKSFGQDFRGAKVYGALYWPWIKVTDPAGVGGNPIRAVPPTGHVLGVYARTDGARGVWKAPAGNEAVMRGALGVERDITDADHTDLVRNGSVNGVRTIPGVGIVVDASRTLSTDTRWLYVNVRLLFNYVKASLRDGLRWVKQEPNRESLWNKIKYNSVTPFLLRLYHDGAFGPGKADDVFTVVVGPENNPPAEIALGNLRVEVYFYPSRPAETIIISVGQQDSAATAAER